MKVWLAYRPHYIHQLKVYVNCVDCLVMECRVMENTSTRSYICDKVVGIDCGSGGAWGSICVEDSSNYSFDLEDAIKTKNRA